jgi:hypothetical protein
MFILILALVYNDPAIAAKANMPIYNMLRERTIEKQWMMMIAVWRLERFTKISGRPKIEAQSS